MLQSLTSGRRSALQVVTLTTVAMLAFAANSLLCRLALKETDIDAASFTAIRLVSGALLLALLLARSSRSAPQGSWRGAAALLLYALAFSFAYVELDAGMGALLLFGAVQLSMLLFGLWQGERLAPLASAGLFMAAAGLLALLLPGASAPPAGSALMMIAAGIAWGAYSLLGRGAKDPLAATAGNFMRAAPLALLAVLLMLPTLRWDAAGAAYAVLSGALASGVGYAIWYAALPSLSSMQASIVQLSVPVIAALAGVALLDEQLTLGMLLPGCAVLGGIALVLAARRPR